MASLVGQQLKDTYDSLLKTSDNDALGAYKEITDGSGNGSGLYLGTGGNVGIGSSPAFSSGSGLEIERAGIATLRLQNTSTGKSTEITQGTNFEIDTVNTGMDIILDATTDTIFEIANSEIARINSTGLGIGTDDPSATLELNSSVSNQAVLKISRSTNPALPNNLQLGTSGGNSTITAIGTDSVNGALIFQRGTTSATAESMRIDSSGNVGIGVSPIANLHIKDGSSSSDVRIQDSTETTTLYLQAQNGLAVVGTITNHDLRFDVNDNEKMRIDSSGNVGIATGGTVDDKFHVIGTSTKIQELGQTGIAMKFNHGNNASVNSDINIANIKSFVSSGSTGSEGGGLTFETKPTAGSATPRMTIDSNGNVGIGVSPATTLDVASGNSGGDPAQDAPTLRITNTTQGNDWDIDDVVGTLEYYASDTSGNAPYVTSFIKSVNEQNNGTLPSGALTFGTATYNASGGAVERLRIDSSGNVGIGVSPSDRLEVKGATAKGALVLSSGDTTIIGNDVIGQINFKDYDADAHAGGDQNDLVNIKAIALHESGGATALDGSTGEGYALSFSTSKRPSPNALFTVSEAMRIDSSGNVSITTGNLILDSGAGIDFSDTADGSGTMTSELLDDYEEGAWTPVLSGASTAGTYEFATSGAYYIKVGRMVTVTANLVLSASVTGGGTGYAKITGLPYAKGANMAPQGTVLFRSVDFADDADYVNIEFVTSGASSELYFPAIRDNTGTVDTQISAFGNSSTINLSITYFT